MMLKFLQITFQRLATRNWQARKLFRAMKKNYSNPEKAQNVPMSTKVFNLIGDAYIFIWWVILCNPISMVIIHWLKPKLASALAHDRLLCGEQMLAFYSKLAQKWPYKWSKWWLNHQDLVNYTAEQQAEYFLKVNDSQKVLDILSSEATLFLVTQYPEKVKKIIKTMRLPDEMFTQCLTSPLVVELPHYIKRGTLPKEQQCRLMYAALADSKFTLDSVAMTMFLQYVERCGLSKELLEKFNKESGGAGFLHCAHRVVRCYEQRMVVRRYHDLDTENAEAEWARYLKKEGKLYVNPSLEMSIEQYKIFRKVGLTLKPDAILRFLKNRDFEMCEVIFRMEPNHGIVNDDIKKLVDEVPTLKERYIHAVAATEKE